MLQPPLSGYLGMGYQIGCHVIGAWTSQHVPIYLYTYYSHKTSTCNLFLVHAL